MVVRWIRNALVLSLAALGVQSVRMIARHVTDDPPAPIPDGPLLIRGTPRVVSPALEPYGAL
jgi:hypothetical protein